MYNNLKLAKGCYTVEWAKISRNNNYSISRSGEVRNDITGKIKKPYINRDNNYLTVDLYKGNRSEKVTVHRLLAEAFIPNPENKPCIDHKDGNRQNNALSNLRWATYSENNSRFSTNGVRSERIRVTHYKEIRNKRGGGHVSWADVDRIEYFEKIRDCAARFDCSQGNITLMLKSGAIGRRGKMRGYLFEYCKDGECVTTTETAEESETE